LGSGLTANRINLSNASGLYLALDMGSGFASTSASLRPLLTLSAFILRCCRVILLEPRTPHQPGKTWERIKERLCFYSFYLCSQQKMRGCICFEFNRVQPLHKPMTGFCANWNQRSLRPYGQHAFPRVRKFCVPFYESPLVWKSREIRDWPNASGKETALGA
jgi:hypothetical protein